MPAKWFKTPNGELMEIETVMKERLLVDHYPSPYLRECAEQRPWTGKPSTTQLIKGTRAAYLEIFHDYAIDPDDQAFRIVGTWGHTGLELQAGKGEMAETKFSEGEISGISDHMEPDPAEPGSYILDDYKVAGSFRVVKALGIVKRTRPMMDENGEPVLYKRGGKWGAAGTPRMEDYYEADPAQADLGDWKLQVNHYRVRAQDELHVKISRMRVFVPVRDGGLMMARNRGVTRKTYSFIVPFMDDDEVRAWFEKRRVALLSATKGYELSIEAGHDPEKALLDNIPEACSKEEAWDGNKCRGYCNVSDICIKHGCPFVPRMIGPSDLVETGPEHYELPNCLKEARNAEE
jgi:hypothetical protein